MVAGSAFGDRGEGHIRLDDACPDDVLEEGLERIRQGGGEPLGPLAGSRTPDCKEGRTWPKSASCGRT